MPELPLECAQIPDQPVSGIGGEEADVVGASVRVPGVGSGPVPGDGRKVILASSVKKRTGEILQFPDPDRLDPDSTSFSFADDETSLPAV